MHRLSYREALIELFLYALPVYLPFFQELLLHGIARALLMLTLAVLLMFLVSRRADIGKMLCAFLDGLGGVLRPLARPVVRQNSGHEQCKASVQNVRSALFQRPPPLFA